MLQVGVDVGGTFTDLFAWDPERGARPPGEGALHARRPVGRLHAGARGRGDRGGRDQLGHPRHDDRHQRADRAPLPRAGAGHHAGLPRRAGDRPPAAQAPLRPLPVQDAAADRAQPPLHGRREARRRRQHRDPARPRRRAPRRRADRRARHHQRRRGVHQRLPGRRPRARDARHPARGHPGRARSRSSSRDAAEDARARPLRDDRDPRRAAAGRRRLPRARRGQAARGRDAARRCTSSSPTAG